MNLRSEYEGVAKYESRFGGNTFMAVNALSNDAEALSERNDRGISGPEAVTWILTGARPKQLDTFRDSRYRFTNSLVRSSSDYLSYISRSDVRQSVFDSLRGCIESQSLSYDYHALKDDSYKRRVRVIVNMLYDRIQQAKIESII